MKLEKKNKNRQRATVQLDHQNIKYAHITKSNHPNAGSMSIVIALDS